MKHILKIWPQYYCRVADGSKTFEVRENDRGFQPGDIVVLKEWDPTAVDYNYGRDIYQAPRGFTNNLALTFKVGYVYFLEDKRVVFSLLKAEEAQGMG